MPPAHAHAAGVSAAEAVDLIRTGALLLDVREQNEWHAGHAAQAELLPMSRLAVEAASLPTDRLLVCVCHVGARSAAVSAALNDAGWTAVNLLGGMQAWAAAGLSVVTETGQPGRVD